MTQPRKPRRPKSPLYGKRAWVVYRNGYQGHYTFHSDGRMEWVTTDPEGVVRKGVERATFLQIDDYTHMLTWIDRKGTAITQVIDTFMCRTHRFCSTQKRKSSGRIASPRIEGTFEFVRDGWEGGSLLPKEATCTPSKS